MCRMAAQLVYIVGRETDRDYKVFLDGLGLGRVRDALFYNSFPGLLFVLLFGLFMNCFHLLFIKLKEKYQF
ncbi:hypothetical protein ISN44_As10g022290 [Arabidopsis suecica]|uniref:Uncharacterized protein n=1 Tax=Arabidopsis suecica TaxID=45249 RepID=A0A8T2A1K8_ARASU|nr:hypothetical protein ISN44_As10g022290 [Arabidopsis suecica]